MAEIGVRLLNCTQSKDSRGLEDDPGVALCAVALLYSKYAHADVQNTASQLWELG